jgi:hypothetical protein
MPEVYPRLLGNMRSDCWRFFRQCMTVVPEVWATILSIEGSTGNAEIWWRRSYALWATAQAFVMPYGS